MVGKTRLYQHIRSPLIRGATKKRRHVAAWTVAVVLVVVAGAVWVYLAYLR
jgi:hypothetical protein